MANMTPSMRHQPFGTGTLQVGVYTDVSMADAPLPATLVLTSSSAARQILISLDGTNFFQPAYDTTQTGQIGVSILSGITSARFFGATGDVWSIL